MHDQCLICEKMAPKIKSGRENIVNESHKGRSISVVDKTLEDKVDQIQYNQKVRLSDIAYQVNVEYGSV